jgi:AmmeMemoRadiSam system protein B
VVIWFSSHTTDDPRAKDIEVIYNDVIDARQFIALEKLRAQPTEVGTGKFIGGLVPHHDVAYEMIHKFYAQQETKAIDLIVLIGPNHQGRGPRYQVVGTTYKTYDGLIEPSDVSAALLKLKGFELADPKMLASEHSIGLHMNYIKAYFPHVPVVALLVHEFGGSKGVEEQVATIKSMIGNKKVIIMGSLDFSHYLTMEAANQKDELTRSLIKNGRYELLWTLRNESMDSPTTAFMTLQLLKGIGEGDLTEFGHSNSALILNQPTLSQTTSYFLYGYDPKNEKE